MSLIVCAQVPLGAIIQEGERMTILWINGDRKDLPTVHLKVTTSDSSQEREHLFRVAGTLTTGKPLLLGQDLIQWRDPLVPVRCLEPPQLPAPLEASKGVADLLLPPDLTLGSIPWLQELPTIPEREGLAPSTTLLITGAAASHPSLSREQLIEAQKEDVAPQRLRQEAVTTEDDIEDLIQEAHLLDEDILYKITRGPHDPANVRNKLVMVPHALHQEVFSLAHDGISGHFGVTRTTRGLEDNFCWPGLRKDVKFIASCPTCQVAGNPNEVVPKAPFRNIPSDGVPCRDVVVDYFTPQGRIRSKSGSMHCLTIIDRFTRYPEAIPVHSESSKNAAKALLQFFCRFGFPATIQLDQGWHFTSKEFRDNMASHGVKYFTSTAYHPESQGFIERLHQSLATTLRKLEHEGGGTWEENLIYALFAARHATSETMGYSPFELLYAHSTQGPLDILYDAWAGSAQAEWAKELPQIQRNLWTAWAVAQASEEASQEWVKLKFNVMAYSSSFEPGDQVLVLWIGATRPLETHFTGPHKILRKRGALNYLVACGKRRAKWLHINLLKPFHLRSEEPPQRGTPALGAVVCNAALARDPTTNSEVLQNLDLITPGVEPTHREDVWKLLHHHSHVVRDSLGCTYVLQHSINTREGIKPIAQRYYRVNPEKARRIEDQVKLQLDLVVIKQSYSSWASPVVLVPKEGGGDRLCADFRKLNEAMETEPYPILRIKACLDSLGSAPYLSKIDLERGIGKSPCQRSLALGQPSSHPVDTTSAGSCHLA
ncbi:uncharacterized protein [Macrobrachium rosenbergii]|uniref:uncharacterized protein n=1 Tax=Macrobrachium rosenbergii TaxID=79674 RepID=UPI0034D44B33